jgi:uncharacterized membrane protein YeaQ/YmgE (transglycosylase-associated protein family)
MDTLVCIAAGSLLGWLSFSYWRVNWERGAVVSMVIGAVGALIGTKAIAPIFLSAASAPGDVTLPFLVFAVGAAAALLVLSHMLRQRFGV